MQKHAAIYARLSNTRGNDLSTERQCTQGRAYFARRKDIAKDAVTEYVEPKGHRSGVSSAGRPRFKELMRDIRAGKIQVLWIYNQSRLSRGEALEIISECGEYGVEVVINGKTIDLANWEDEISVMTSDFIDKMYSRKVSRDIKQRYAHERESGAWIGKPPCGLKLSGKSAERKVIASDESYKVGGIKRTYLDTIRKYFELYTQPRALSRRECAERLNASGYKFKSVHGNAVAVTVQQLADVRPGSYRGIIDDALIDKVIRRIDERKGRKENRRVGKKSEFVPPLLWRVAVCDKCGRKLHTNNTHGYPGYAHAPGDCANRGRIPARLLDELAIGTKEMQRVLTLTDEERDRIANAAHDIGKETNADFERKQLAEQLARLESQAVDLVARGVFSESAFAAKKKELQKKLDALPADSVPRRSVAEYSQVLKNFRAVFETARERDPFLANRLMRDLFEEIRVIIKPTVSIVRVVSHPDVAAWLLGD